MAEILIVEDDRIVRDGYKRLFEGEGYFVRIAKNGEEALKIFSMHCPDVVLLDIDMPDMNGFFVCGKMREMDTFIPIVFLTQKVGDADQVRAFNLGADDYIFKTVSESVLVTRVKSIIDRRSKRRLKTDVGDGTIQIGQVIVNLATREVSYGSRKTMYLTRNEMSILQALNSERGRLFTKEEIAEFIHGGPYTVEASSFRGYITGLRSKLGPAKEMISTVRDGGYKLIK